MGKGIQFPLWLHIVCEIIFASFILRGLYAIWKYAVYQHIFARKKCVEATLVSKVKERYREIIVHLTKELPCNSFFIVQNVVIYYVMRFYEDMMYKLWIQI